MGWPLSILFDGSESNEHGICKQVSLNASIRVGMDALRSARQSVSTPATQAFFTQIGQ